MSSVNDILDATTKLVAKVDELLQTDTVQALPEVAAELGIEEVFNEGVTVLADLLRSLDTELGRLDEALEQLDGLVALLGLIEPLIESLANMVGSGANSLAAYGLDGPAGAIGDAGQYIGYAAQAKDVAEAVIPDPRSFGELRDQIGELADTIEGLRTDADAEPGDGQEAAA